MDEQGAREHKLLDCVEALAKAAQEPARSLDRHHLVLSYAGTWVTARSGGALL
jgi:hypothetical protein